MCVSSVTDTKRRLIKKLEKYCEYPGERQDIFISDTEASNAYNKLAGDNNVLAVAGPTISATTAAVAPLADQSISRIVVAKQRDTAAGAASMPLLKVTFTVLVQKL